MKGVKGEGMLGTGAQKSAVGAHFLAGGAQHLDLAANKIETGAHK